METKKRKDVCNILGVEIDRLTIKEMLDKVEGFIGEKLAHEIYYVNSDCINRFFLDKKYRLIVKNADLVYPDGMGVVWASRFTQAPLKERVNLGDFLPQLCSLCAQKGYSVYILAGAEGVAQEAANNLRKNFPGLNIKGVHHGFFDEKEESAIIDEINALRPDVLLVGMGVPKQEKWIHRNKRRLNTAVLWGVGALFDYYSLRIKRAPVWMRQTGLEWLFRLGLEPSRLWRRYILGNIFFIWRVFLLLLVDAVFVSIAWCGAYWVRYSLNSVLQYQINPFGIYIRSLPFVIMLWIGTCAYFNLYIPRWSRASKVLDISSIMKAVIMGLLVAMSLSFLLKEFDYGRSVILLWGIFSFTSLAFSRALFWYIDNKMARRKYRD